MHRLINFRTNSTSAAQQVSARRNTVLHKVQLAACIVLGATAVFGASASSAATNVFGPHLYCPAPLFQFGTATNQNTIVHTFDLCNDGQATVHITRVAASCGCLVPELDRKEIPPGGQTALRATFSLAGRMGHQRRVIRIMTEDAVVPAVELWMEGDIARFPFEPETINFGTLLPSDTSAQISRLVGVSATNRVLRTQADNTNFVASVTDDGHGVVVRTRPPLPDGISRAMVQAFTDNSTTPVANVPVTAMVVPAVRIMPSTIALTRGAPYATRIIWVRPGRSGIFSIREVHSTADEVTPILTNIGAGIYRIDLKNIPVSDALQGKAIIITTTLADTPTLKIPFIFEAATP